jgi:hypothetical protein
MQGSTKFRLARDACSEVCGTAPVPAGTADRMLGSMNPTLSLLWVFVVLEAAGERRPECFLLFGFAGIALTMLGSKFI